jgi:hypothetical protein
MNGKSGEIIDSSRTSGKKENNKKKICVLEIETFALLIIGLLRSSL